MDPNERIASIASTIASRKTAWRLGPPLPPDAVAETEARCGFTLPEEYRSFITRIGNGGTIPSPDGGGTVTLLPFPNGVSEQTGAPFPLTESWDLQTGTDFDQPDSSDELLVEKAEHTGCLHLIQDPGEDGMSWRLIVTGERRGEVWLSDSSGYLRLPGCTFWDWLERYLNRRLVAYTNQVAEAEKQAERDAIQGKELAAIRKLMNSRKRKSIRWDPPIPLADVKRFETRHGIVLPSEYVRFITEVASGCTGLPTVNAGPNGVMLRLDALDGLQGLAQPFPYPERSPELERRLLTAYNWAHTIWDDELSAPPEDLSSVWASPQYSVLHGALPLALYHDTGPLQGNTQAFLILNGDYAGQICTATKYSLCIGGTQPSFFSWLIQTLKYGAL